MRGNLAIVIPAYRSKFLFSALDSLANQTNKNFTVYIGDDNSPEDLKAIVKTFETKFDLKYYRFNNNIGGKHLVTQWERCIELTINEKWLWLFSDDDIADENCVQTFFDTIEADSEEFDVYRFNTRVIDELGNIMQEANESPFVESSFDMTLGILRNERGNRMQDQIFSRKIYNRKGGFVKTDYAQSADFATSIFFSDEKGICSMKNAKVSWRLGNSNISGRVHKNRADKQKGYFQFLDWTYNHFLFLKSQDVTKWEMLKEAMTFNYIFTIHKHYKGLSIRNFMDSYYILIKVSKDPVYAFLYSLKLIIF